jgi:hypothetical protein
MPRILQTSIVVQFARRASAESVVWRTITSAARAVGRAAQSVASAVRRVDAVLTRSTPPRSDADDERRVKAVLVQSRLVRWIDAALDVPPRAWASSAVRRRLQPVHDEVRAQPAHEQVRLVGLMLAAAAATHIVLVVLFSEPVGWPTWIAWTVFLGVACALVVWRREIVAGWANRRPWVRRLLRESDTAASGRSAGATVGSGRE